MASVPALRISLELRFNQSVSSVLSLINYVYLVGFRIQENVEVMSKHLHLEAGLLWNRRLDGEFLCLYNFNFVILGLVLRLDEGL